MKTLELRPVHPATKIWDAPSGHLANSNADQISLIDRDKDWSVVVKAKPYRQQGVLTKLEDAAPARRESHRWGVVLAGGDGLRLRELTRWVCGDDRPKQFCPLFGARTLLQETRLRAERSLPADQILYLVTRAHEKYYLHDLAAQGIQRIVQPSNKGTVPAILCALIRIAQADADAIVSILPSDHYYSPESAFTATLESAIEIAGQRPGSVVLLGAQPNGPEIEYGWIEMGPAIYGHSRLFRVQNFREKPALSLAEALLKSGSLWNTFVMVGHVRAFLEMARATAPSLLEKLESLQLLGSPTEEIRIPDHSFYQITPMDFSREILAPAKDHLLTLRLDNIEWSDLGNPYRVLVTLLEATGELPSWAKLWSEPDAIPRASAATA